MPAENKTYTLDAAFLKKAVRGELLFLELVDRCPGLVNPGNTLKRAIYR